jgi:hypothetical protein
MCPGGRNYRARHADGNCNHHGGSRPPRPTNFVAFIRNVVTGTPNSFFCYKTKCPKTTLPALSGSDQFGSRTVTPSVAKLVCAPLAGPTTTTTSTTTTATSPPAHLPATGRARAGTAAATSSLARGQAATATSKPARRSPTSTTGMGPSRTRLRGSCVRSSGRVSVSLDATPGDSRPSGPRRPTRPLPDVHASVGDGRDGSRGREDGPG